MTRLLTASVLLAASSFQPAAKEPEWRLVKVGNLQGYTDDTGEIRGGVSFSEDPVPARQFDELFSYIDIRGRWVVEPRYFQAGPLPDGLAPVRLDKDGLWSCADRQFKDTIPACFRKASAFRKGWAAVREEESAQSGFIDRSGALGSSPEVDGNKAVVSGGIGSGAAVWGVYLGLCESRGCALVKSRGKWGLIDTKSIWAVAPQFDALLPIKRGWAYATIGDANGYVNAKGERRHWSSTRQ